MGRSHVSPITQPNDITCGPSALKHALSAFGTKRSLTSLATLCKTNNNGTTTRNLIAAANKLGYSVLAIEYATLTHLQHALNYPPHQHRVVLVSYLYELDEQYKPHPDSGHWAMVASYAASKNRIVILDSYSGKHKSYAWPEFRSRWKDFDLKRKKLSQHSKHFKLIRHWQPQLMLVLAKEAAHLPKFAVRTQHLFPVGE